MAVECRVLGEVEVCLDGRRIDVGHARQRWVLACLLVDVNRPVTAEQLIDRVWSDEPPYRARNALASYVSRLRHLLGDLDGVQIERGPGGYTLTADPRAVDLHAFRQLAADARSAPDPARAAAAFDRALALWHGEPFAALDTPWAHDMRTSLAAEQFSVILERNDAALAAGRHADVVDELAATLAAHPLDERVAGQLMLAQARNGRQADALTTYRRMRELLADELGVDPGPALQAVHRQILDGEAAPPPPAATAVPTPRTGLPRRATRTIGRDADIDRATTALADAALVTLTGVGGVGKTRLALEVADRAHDDFAEGVVVCELAPLGDGSAVSHAVATALRVQPGPGRGFDEAIVDHLRSLELLLVVDNCEHVLAEAAELLDRIARSCPRVKVLATSREPVAVEGERVVPVPPLRAEYAVELFTERARSSRPDFDPVREPVGAVAEICRRLDGVPLALELAAARMRAMSSLDVARRLDRLRLLSGGTRGAHPRQQSVTATIDWSYQLLSPPEQEFFARLSVFAGGFDLEAAHEACADDDTCEDDTLDLLTGLVDKSMVIIRGGGPTMRYGVLETLRAYGRERLSHKGIDEAMAARHAEYYVSLLERTARGMVGPDERYWVDRMTPDAAATYTAPDFENLRAAFEFVMAAGDENSALRAVLALPDLMNRIGYHSADWIYRVVDAADTGHRLFPAALGVAARAAWVLGDHARIRDIAARADVVDSGPSAVYLGHLADVLADTDIHEGAPDTALAYYERELPRGRAGADRLRFVLIVDRITMCHQALGTPDAGLAAAREAVSVADGTGNPTTRSLARCALGRAVARSDPAQALTVLRDAAAFAQSVSNNWLIGIARQESATIGAEHGDPAEAARTHLELMDHWERGAPGVIVQQWDALRSTARLLLRVGAHGDAAALDAALVAAGRRPALSGDRAGTGGAPMTGAEAVKFARAVLRRFA